MLYRHRWLIILLLLFVSVPLAEAQTDERCFPETGFCISGRIRTFWEQNGGLPVFGFPIAPQRAEQIEGRSIQIQWFERNRLELHPENAAPYDVLIGRVGADRLIQQGRDPSTFPQGTPQTDCRFFAETQHNACGDILAAWRARGLNLDNRAGTTEAESLALFGLPLSEATVETLSNGQQYTVQWFERARFEVHPENPPEARILLGLLGNELQTAPQAPPPQAPAPAACGEVPSVGTSTATPSCLRGGDKVDIVARGLTPGDFISLRLNTPDGNPYEFAIISGDPAVGPDGSYSISGALPPGVPPGVYTLIVNARKSRVDVAVPFGIAAGPPSGVDASVLPPSVGGPTAFASPSIVRRIKEPVRFHTDDALPPNEEVSIYGTYPNGQVIGAPFRLKTNQHGGITSKLTFSTFKEDPYGIYATTFEVIATGQKVIIYFRVIPEE